jgi:hypothetical protein
MKMKKTLAFIMTAALTIGTMAGCSQATLNYASELSKTAKWEATTSNIEGTVSVNASGVQEQINMTATGYTANNQSYVDIKFTDPSGKLNIPELTAYSDGKVSYINKSFYEGIYALTGQTVPAELASIKEEYIGIDSGATGVNVDQINALTNQPDAMVQLGKLVFGENNDLDLPFVQNGREFTMNLDANKTVDLAAKAVKAACNNLDNLNSTFKLGLTADDIAQAKKEVNDAKFDASLNDVKTALAGTTISSKEVFTDTSYTGDLNVNLQIKDFGSIAIEMKSSSTKSEVKAITLPTSKVIVKSDEFNNISTTTNTTSAIRTTENIKNIIGK